MGGARIGERDLLFRPLVISWDGGKKDEVFPTELNLNSGRKNK